MAALPDPVTALRDLFRARSRSRTYAGRDGLTQVQCIFDGQESFLNVRTYLGRKDRFRRVTRATSKVQPNSLSRNYLGGWNVLVLEGFYKPPAPGTFFNIPISIAHSSLILKEVLDTTHEIDAVVLTATNPADLIPLRGSGWSSVGSDGIDEDGEPYSRTSKYQVFLSKREGDKKLLLLAMYNINNPNRPTKNTRRGVTKLGRSSANIPGLSGNIPPGVVSHIAEFMGGRR